MSFRTSSAPAAWRRALLALLVSLALGFDMMALHDAGAEHSAAPYGVEIAESAIHPGDPAHFEASDIRAHHGCPGCLVQLQMGLAPASQVSIASPVPGPALTAPAEQAIVQIAVLCGPARAPPVSSPSA